MCAKQEPLTCLSCKTQIFSAFYFQDAEIRVPSTYSEEVRNRNRVVTLFLKSKKQFKLTIRNSTAETDWSYNSNSYKKKWAVAEASVGKQRYMNVWDDE